MDETWSFVRKKEDHRAPEFNSRCGKHVAFDPEHRLVLSVVNGKRSQRHVRRRLCDVERVMCAAVEHDRRVPCLQNRDSFRLREQARRAVIPGAVHEFSTGIALRHGPQDAQERDSGEGGGTTAMWNPGAMVPSSRRPRSIATSTPPLLIGARTTERRETPIVSARTGRSTKPSPRVPCTRATSADRYERYGEKMETATIRKELRP